MTTKIKPITPKCSESLKAYVLHRSKYGICGAKMSLIHLRMLENQGYVVRGPFGSIDSFTKKGEELLLQIFNGTNFGHLISV